jgi:hypothetical protein
MMRDVEVTQVAELKAKYLEPLNKLSGYEQCLIMQAVNAWEEGKKAQLDSSRDFVLNRLDQAEQKYCDIVKSDVCLALAEIEMKKAQYAAAEEYLITSIDLTDKVFDRHSHRVRHVLEKISISQINLKKFFFAGSFHFSFLRSISHVIYLLPLQRDCSAGLESGTRRCQLI